jgi:hypothetical protein
MLTNSQWRHTFTGGADIEDNISVTSETPDYT